MSIKWIFGESGKSSTPMFVLEISMTIIIRSVGHEEMPNVSKVPV